MLQAHFLKKPLVVGKYFKRLYILDKEEIQGLKFQEKRKYLMSVCTENRRNKIVGDCFFVSPIRFDVWHQRLGHMSHNKMRAVSELVQFQNNEKGFIFDIRPRAKQHRLHRLPFPASHTSSVCIFELIHVDTWGP